MTSQSLKQNIIEIRNLIISDRLSEAIDALKSIAEQNKDYAILDSIKILSRNYGYMLQYMLSGADDPSRNDLFFQTKNGLLDLCDKLLFNIEIIYSNKEFYSVARTCRYKKEEFPQIWESLLAVVDKESLAKESGNIDKAIMEAKDRAMRGFFNYLWTSIFDGELQKQVSEKILSSVISVDTARYAISALTLSLLGFYDKYKFATLLDIYDQTESETLAAYSLVGIVLATERHRQRISADKKMLSRMSLWQDSLLTYSRLKIVIKEIIRTRDTDRVAAKMRDEVIPELMKLRPDMLKKMRDAGMDFESGMLENNPEWEEMLEKNGVAEKMRELTEMQSEGADLLMVTFANLKNFPFFYPVDTWFMPFNPSHPMINLPQNFLSSIEKILSMGANMCDSDKYSLVLALGSMPEQQRKMMFSQFEQQMSQISEENLERMNKQSNVAFSRSAIVFIRELYRFFKLHRKKNEFEDPFIKPLNFLSLPVIGEMTSDDEIISVVGEFYFKRGFYKEALDLFSAMQQTYASDHSYWEKVGYAYQSLKEYEKALESYSKSALLSDPGQWLLMRLAHVNKKLKRYAEAAEYYGKALENDTDNVSLLMNVGNAILETGSPQKALQHFYHADYLDSHNIKIKRAIAWAELIAGNFNKSEQIYQKIIFGNIGKPNYVDYLNFGHASLASNNLGQALSLYRTAFEADPSNFQRAFDEDRQILSKLGIEDTTQALVLEALKFKDIDV